MSTKIPVEQIVKTNLLFFYRSMTPLTRTPRLPTLSIPMRTPPKPSSTSMLVSAQLDFFFENFPRGAKFYIFSSPCQFPARSKLGNETWLGFQFVSAVFPPTTSFESPLQFNLIPPGPPARGGERLIWSRSNTGVFQTASRHGRTSSTLFSSAAGKFDLRWERKRSWWCSLVIMGPG